MIELDDALRGALVHERRDQHGAQIVGEHGRGARERHVALRVVDGERRALGERARDQRRRRGHGRRAVHAQRTEATRVRRGGHEARALGAELDRDPREHLAQPAAIGRGHERQPERMEPRQLRR